MPDLLSTPDLLALWHARLEAGELTFDPAQEDAVKVMQIFLNQALADTTRGENSFKKLFNFLKPSSSSALNGLYMYGDVGRGKTMLMDLFFDAVPLKLKRRVHFHSFMLEIHERLHKIQQELSGSVLPELARELAKETRLLCFDEFHVSNIADAMILSRLFSALFEAGVMIFSTSNWPPDDLYKNGLQRERFLPFIDLIKTHMMVHHIKGAIDYRYQQVHGLPICFYPLGDDSTRKLQGIFMQLTDEAQIRPITLPLQGRTLRIVHTANGVGFFNFNELCGQPLGAADYLAIAQCLHTIIIDEVPIMQADRRDETLRFMTLIDTLYEAKTKLFIAASAAPEKLAPKGEHSFAFERTVSRLAEMGSEDYRHKPHMG